MIDVVIMGNHRLRNALAERERLYEVEMTDAIGIRLGELEEIIGEEDGYSAESDAEILLNGMGIPPKMHARKDARRFRQTGNSAVLLCQALFR